MIGYKNRILFQILIRILKLSLLLVILASGAFYIHLLKNNCNNVRLNERERQLEGTESKDAFFHELPQYYKVIEKLQSEIDVSMKSREFVIGNIAWYPTQVHYYARAVSQEWVKTVCEVGYGAGHSALLYLSMNKKAHLYSFDIFPYTKEDVSKEVRLLKRPRNFQWATLATIAQNPQFLHRFDMIPGDSNITIPNFIRKNPNLKCDFISIDGSHVPPQPYFDILNFKRLSHIGTIVILDDMHPPAMRNDLNRAIRENILTEYECIKPEYRTDPRFAAKPASKKEFCAVRYVL